MNPYFLVGIDDPTKKETFAPKGALYARAGDLGGTLYQKQDEGSSTNWKLVGAIELDLGEGAVDLNAIISKKENIGVASQLTNALESRLTQKMNASLSEVSTAIENKVNQAINGMNATVEQMIASSVANKTQTFFADKEKDFSAFLAMTKNTLENSIHGILSGKMTDMSSAITVNVTEAVKASSAVARNILVEEFRARIDTAYQTFKLELTAQSEAKIKATFDAVCAAASKTSEESYALLIAEVKKQTDDFKTASEAFLAQTTINHDLISERLTAFQSEVDAKVNAQVVVFFDNAKKTFYDKLKQDFTLSINKAVQELQIYVNERTS